MSDQTPRSSRRRRIAGETPTPPPAAPAPAAKKAAPKKAAAKKDAPKKSAAPVQESKAAPPRRTPASKVAAAVAARDTGAPTPTPSPRPVIPPPAPTATPKSSPTTEKTPRSTRGFAVSIGFLVLGVVIAGLGVAHWQGLFDSAGGEDARTALNAEEVAAASDAAETIFSFSYDDLEAHADEAKALMTDDFAKQYDTIAPALDDLAPQRKVEVTATVRNAAVLPCGDDCSTSKASVLVFLDQDRRLADDDTPTVFGNRIVVDLVRSGDDWKVDDIRAL